MPLRTVWRLIISRTKAKQVTNGKSQHSQQRHDIDWSTDIKLKIYISFAPYDSCFKCTERNGGTWMQQLQRKSMNCCVLPHRSQTSTRASDRCCQISRDESFYDF